MSLSENSSHLPSKRNPILRPCDLELEREEEILGVTHYAILFLSFFLKPYAGGEFSLIPDEHITAWFLMSAAKKIMKEKQQTSTGNRLNHYNKVRDKMEPAKKVVQQIPCK